MMEHDNLYKSKIEEALSFFTEAMQMYCQPGRELSLAITNAEQAAMWAMRSIDKTEQA